jgi:hypothetical protein
MIEPTPGRIVHFRTPPRPCCDYAFDEGSPPGGPALPAIITVVHTPRCIDVVVFGLGESSSRKYERVVLLQDDDAAPATVNWCEWMPFQKGQAGKTEELIRSFATGGAAQGAGGGS